MMKLWGKYLFGVALTFLCVVTFAAPAGVPKGTYTVKTSEGVWELNFDGKGKYVVNRNGAEKVVGAYEVTRDEIKFVDHSGPFAEKTEATKSGTYKWKYADKKLEFTIINDKAEGRSQTLTSGPWEMKE
jgi:hypothetical protein